MALGYQNPCYLKQAQQKQQSLYNGKVLLEKHDPPTVYDSEETLELAQESRLKMQLLNKEIKPANYTKINHLSGVFVSQTAKSREELYLSNTFKTANVSKSISIPNEEFSDDTTPSVARKFLNEVKSTIVTLQPDESLAKHKALELEIERLLRAVVSQDIMSIMQNNSMVDTSNFQTELDRTKERLENYTLDPLFQKLENEKVELEFQIRNYEKENAYLKAVYKNLFDSINVTRTQTKTIIDYLQNKLHDMIYENTKLRAQLFDKVSEQKDTTRGTNANTKFAKQSILGIPPSSRPKLYDVNPLPKSMTIPKVGETNALIDPRNTSREDKFVPIHNVRAIDVTTKTRRPQPKSNTKNDRVPSASQSSCIKNTEVKVEEHHRNLLLSNNPKHMSSECNNIKLSIRNDKFEVVYAMYKKCLITTNHYVCMLNYVNGMKPRGKKQKEKVSNIANQTKHKPHVWKLENVGPKERLASPKPSKPRMCLRWSPTGKMFDFKGKLITSSESNGDKACYPNMFMVCRLGLFQAYDGNLKLIINFVWKFLGTVRFGNDHVAAILGFHLKVAFRRNTCFIRNLKGVDLLKGNRTTNLYTINLHDMASASPIFLMARATSTKSWLWHQRLSHLNFDTINDLARNDLVIGLPNGVVERRNRMLMEAARTMLIFSRAPLFLWAEAIATACYTQNRSIIHRQFDKTPYDLINGRKLDISFLHVFGALCYPKNDREDIRKLGAKGLDLPYSPSTITTQQPTKGELDLLFEAMYDDHVDGQPSAAPRTVLAAQAPQVLQTPTSTTTIADTTSTPTNSFSQTISIPSTLQMVDELETQQQHGQPHPITITDNVPNAMFDDNKFVNPFATPSASAAESSSSQYVDPSNMHTFYQPYPHEYQWTKDHPLEQVIGEPSRPVLTRNQLRSDDDMCMYALTVSTMEPKNVNEAMTDPVWIESMQEELLQFKRLNVWVLVPLPDHVKPLTLKWLFKNKHDEENTVIRNKTRLVMRGYRQEEGIDF
ncbi:retrovirus-related pol polyprotein from transposon TNT 1-94 [Tanacetum coccineum]